MTSWSGRVETSHVKDVPRTRIEYHLSAIPASIRNRPKMNTAVRPLLIAAPVARNATHIPIATLVQTEAITNHFEPESWSVAPGGSLRFRKLSQTSVPIQT